MQLSIELYNSVFADKFFKARQRDRSVLLKIITDRLWVKIIGFHFIFPLVSIAKLHFSLSSVYEDVKVKVSLPFSPLVACHSCFSFQAQEELFESACQKVILAFPALILLSTSKKLIIYLCLY